jgi:carbon-monoxide dehydrogenase small subunit
MVLTVRALLAEQPRPGDAEIREFLSGNFCRCAGYTLILAAVRELAGSAGAERP